MRIIAGQFRGRRLLPPEGWSTRPITDRVKQSLFDILTPVLPEAIVYDCFAGTGSLGLECLSRGSAAVTFLESDRSALSRLRQNISALKVEARSRVIAGDLFRWLGDARSAPEAAGRATLVFLDPPYRFLAERADALRQLARDLASLHLAPGAMVVFRHDAAQSLELAPLVPCDTRVYGSMTLEFLRVRHEGDFR